MGEILILIIYMVSSKERIEERILITVCSYRERTSFNFFFFVLLSLQ